MVTRRDSVWKTVDWVTIVIYLLLVVGGWFSVCGASYDYVDRDFLDFSTRAGKQFVWIVCSFGLGVVLLLLDDMFYDTFAYLIYAGMLLLLLVTIFIAPDTKGSRSWLILGPVSIQPAEFAKFATALALAKFMGAYGFVLHRWRSVLTIAFLILCPMLLIVGQRETGSALVYLSFSLMLYREGMPGAVLFAGVCAVVYFVVGIRFGDVWMFQNTTSVGEFSVLCLILISVPALLRVYLPENSRVRLWPLAASGVGVVLLACALSGWLWAFNVVYVLWGLCAVAVGWLFYMLLRERRRVYAFIAVFLIASVGFLYSCDYVFDRVLEPHQQVRIKVLLGLEEDLAGAGYNVNQSKIAIGSGGLWGKGFLNGTQTKLKYVPEQDTDFIFCTVGEEEGFVGSVSVLLLYMALILRLIWLSERQPTVAGRVYGYCVMGVFFFHLFINVGMVLGLTPVIGIPLPFFSYGGSSLWGFTILLFVFLRIDAARGLRTR